MKRFISIVIPAYNEEEAIGKDIDVIRTTMDKTSYEYEMIVVDDGCTDKTPDIAEKRGAKVLRHPHNKGVGAARKTGIKAAKGDIIVMTDADCTYPNQDIPRLLEHMDDYEMVIGARKSEQGTIRALRRPAKFFLRKLAEYVTREKIADLNSGFRAFQKDIALRYFNILPQGHSWVSTITIAFLSHNYNVKFIPIDYYRRKGKSTFHPIKDTYAFLTLIIKTIMYFNPLRIFMPLTLLLFVAGFARTVYDASVLHKVKESDIMLVMTSIIVGALGLMADLMSKVFNSRVE
jgi:glycosyltransferase involved in cell wall biosynthesis